MPASHLKVHAAFELALPGGAKCFYGFVFPLGGVFFSPEPTSQDAKPRVKPRVHPPHLLYKRGSETRVTPGV
jgi:hypothetical protein